MSLELIHSGHADKTLRWMSPCLLAFLADRPAPPAALPGLPRRAVAVRGPGAAADTRLRGSPPADTPRSSARADGLTPSARGAMSLCAPVILAATSVPHGRAPTHTQSTPDARGARTGHAIPGHRVGLLGCNARGSAPRLAHPALGPNASIGSSYDRSRSLGPYRPIDTGHSSPRPAANTSGLCCCGRLVVAADPVWPGQHRSLLDSPGPGSWSRRSTLHAGRGLGPPRVGPGGVWPSVDDEPGAIVVDSHRHSQY